MTQTGLILGDRTAPARVAAAATILLGLVSLTGWALGIQAFTSIIPGSVEMKANTAVCVVLCGIALMILSERTFHKLEILAQIAGICVFLIAAATLTEYFFGWQMGIDELVLQDRIGAFGVFRGRMSPFSAAAFVAIAAALLGMPYRRVSSIVSWGAASAIAIGLVSLIGYILDAGEIITDRWLPPVAINTASCFTFLGGGILFSPRKATAGSDQRIESLAAVEIKILAGFLVALALLLVGGTYTYRTNMQFADSVEWVAHTQEVRTSLASLYGSLAGAEVALRDYVLTTEPRYRDEYRRLTDEVQKQLGELHGLTMDNVGQQKNLAELEPIVRARLAAMKNALTAYVDFGLPAARAVIALGRKTNATQDVHELTDRMNASEEHLLATRQAQTAHARHTTLISLLVTLAAASTLFIALFRGIHREMLARREAENALRGSEYYNRSIVDASPDCLGILTLTGQLTQMTPQGCRLMEVDDFSAVANIDWVKIWKGTDRAAAKSAVEAARSGKDGRFQGFCATVKGTPKWWDVIVMPIFGANGEPQRLLAVARDISDVKRTESDLLETNRFLDSLIENMPVMVVVKDAQTLRFVRQNRAFERLLGFSRVQLVGKSDFDVFSPEEAAAIVATDREALDSGRLVEIPEQVLDTADLGARTFHTMKMPIGGGGKPQYVLAMSVDITERKLAEQAIHELNSALEAKAAQLQATNNELESFSYSVSHDLRAPLRAIDGFALMVEEDFSERLDSDGRRYLAVIRENSRRMGELIDDLLAFSRLGRLPVALQEINVESLVGEVIEEISSGRTGTAPRFSVGTLPPARADRTLLRQVWVNLLSNAIKYSGKASNPCIEVSGTQGELENSYSVRDNGVGFSMEYVDKLFGVFQRLHRADEFSGTGVGLAIVHRVVTRHGGRVWAEGKVNGGAVFSFALPRGESG